MVNSMVDATSVLLSRVEGFEKKSKLSDSRNVCMNRTRMSRLHSRMQSYLTYKKFVTSIKHKIITISINFNIALFYSSP